VSVIVGGDDSLVMAVRWLCVHHTEGRVVREEILALVTEMMRTIRAVARYQLTRSVAVSGLGVRREVSSLFREGPSHEGADVVGEEGEVSEFG
jgi:hypothetical protein